MNIVQKRDIKCIELLYEKKTGKQLTSSDMICLTYSKKMRHKCLLRSMVLTNIQPVACKSTLDITNDNSEKSIEMEFSATPYQSDIVNLASSTLAQVYVKWLEGLGYKKEVTT